MEKHKPQRTCVCCRKVFDKSELLRVVRLPSGEFILDKTNKADGRGCYICKNESCIEKLVKTRALNRSFKCAISSEIYDKIVAELKKD